MKFAVVLFVDTDCVEVVPKSWVFGSVDGTLETRWPSLKGKILATAVRTGEPPQPEWPSFRIELLKEKDDYDRAMHACRKAMIGLSDLSTTDDDQKRRRTAPKHFGGLRDEASPTRLKRPVSEKDVSEKTKKQKKSESELPPVPTFPALTRSTPPSPSPSLQALLKPQSSHQLSTPPSPTPSLQALSEPEPSHQLVTPQTPTSNNEEDEKLKQILRLVLQVKQQVQQNANRLLQNTQLLQQVLNKGVGDVNGDVNISEHITLPIRSEHAFEEVERILADTDVYKCLVQHLRSLGGGTAREVVDRIMTEVITNEMAARFNWQGRGKLNKLPLSKYALSKAVKEAAKSSNVREAEAEGAMKNWLKYANDREGGRKIRADKKREQQQQQREEMRQRAAAMVLSSSDSESE